jgi:hypothetical protein
MISDEHASDSPPTKRKLSAPTQFTIDLAGDRRQAENVIVEVGAIAQRLGVKISNVQVTRRLSVRQKVHQKSRRKSYSFI